MVSSSVEIESNLPSHIISQEFSEFDLDFTRPPTLLIVCAVYYNLATDGNLATGCCQMIWYNPPHNQSRQ